MAKVAKDGNLVFEHADYDWSAGPIELHAARNETVAFQLVLRRVAAQALKEISLTLGPVSVDSDSVSANAIMPVLEATNQQTTLSQSVFNAFYHPIDDAGYTWGPATPVLPWPAEYPDALVPFQHGCTTNGQIASDPLQTIKLSAPEAIGSNQAVWVDSYIPKDFTPGSYSQTLKVTIDNDVIELPIRLIVHEATLPDKPSINAVGEIYRSYQLEGAGFDITSTEWRAMAQCYQRLAHQHRMVFIERLPGFLTNDQLNNYADTIEPALTGTLFSETNGYIGPGANTPVSIWKTPWPQTIDAASTEALDDLEINRFVNLAAVWRELTVNRGWTNTDYFAYVFDEVDGPNNVGNGNETRDQYIERVHQQMAQVQTAIDQGSGNTAIDLIWTSHSNPTVWENQPALDLTDKIRLWAPNASAADTRFLGERIAAGEKAWFYHSGHPAVGAHSINVSGVEMRTWGVVGARYGFQGQFMWAVNLGSDDFPFRDPQYTPAETRAGNGVMVYPGNQLDKIGYEKSPGPVPSMRLKAWRRGLQDAELYFLAAEKSPVAAAALLSEQVPRALSDGDGPASWPADSAAWIDFHKKLLSLASSP